MKKVIKKTDITNFLAFMKDAWPFQKYSQPWGVPFTYLAEEALKTPFKRADFETQLEFLNHEDKHKKATLFYAEVSDGFKDVLEYFKGKDASLFYEWLRRTALLFDKTGNLNLHIQEIDAKKSEPLSLPNEGLKSISVDVTGLTKEQLTNFLQKIKAHPFFSIHIKGEPSPDFLKALSNVELIQVESQNPAIKKLASQMTHRNHLKRLLAVNSDDNQTLIKQWIGIHPYRTGSPNKLYYLKPSDVATGQELYCNHIHNLYDSKARKKEEDFRVNKNNWSANFEFYSAINGCVIGMDDLFFELLIKELPSLPGLSTSALEELVISRELNELMMQQLIDTPLPFKKLNLFINQATVKSPLFPKLLAILNQRGIEQLTLTKKNDEEKPIELKDELFKEVNYFITINNVLSVISPLEGYHNNDHLALEQPIMERVQDINYQRVLAQKPIQTPVKEVATKTPEKDSEFANKIAIKRHIWNPQNTVQPENDYINLEVRHVEIEQEEQVIAVQQSIAEAIQLEEEQLANLQSHNTQEDLVYYGLFQAQPYYGLALHAQMGLHIKYRDTIYPNIQSQLFCSMPKGIRYMTHEAAIQVSRNIQAYAAFNISHLPEHFFLKKMPSGQLILDYNPYAQTNINTPFTPCPLTYTSNWDSFLNRKKPTEDQVTKWVPNKEIRDVLCTRTVKDYFNQESAVTDSERLVYLYNKFGAAGCQHFFEQLSTLTANHKDVALFLAQHYLKCFSQLDGLLNNNHFFEALERINHFDKIQLACFKKFLENTGNSQHDLKKTVIAFEFFWGEWTKLCAKNTIDVARINVNWITPKAGNPVVYMDRLLTILSNAQNLNEQLDDLDGLVLDYTGAYYASKYEGFRHVSNNMHLTGEESFYALQWPRLTALLSKKDQYKHLYRFMACCPNRISIKTFQEGIQRLEKKNKEIDLAPTLLTALLVTTNVRYKTSDSLDDILNKAFELQTIAPAIHQQFNQKMFELQQSGLLFNSYEAQLICQIIIDMQKLKLAADQESTYFKQLFEALKANRYGTLRYLERLVTHPQVNKNSIIPALEMNKKLGESAALRQYYQDDLLLFSGLFSSSNAQSKEEIAKSLSNLQSDLTQAATAEKPNNLDYLFRRLIQCAPYYDMPKVIALFDQVKQLKSVDNDAVNQIIHDAGFVLSNTPSKLSQSNDNESITRCRTELFTRLNELGAANPTLNKVYSEKALLDNWTLVTQTLSQAKKAELLFPLKKASIDLVFGDSVFNTFAKHGIYESSFFTSCYELATVGKMTQDVTPLADRLRLIGEQDKAWPSIDWKKYSNEEINLLLSLMVSLLNRPHTKLFNDLVQIKASAGTHYTLFLKTIGQLHDAHVPDTWLHRFMDWIANKSLKTEGLSEQLATILSHFKENAANPLVDFIMTSPTPILLGHYALLETIQVKNHQVITELLQSLTQKNQLTDFMSTLQKMNNQSALLQIIARIHTRADAKNTLFDYTALAGLINTKFTSDDQTRLLEQFMINPPSPLFFSRAASTFEKTKTKVSEFLKTLETSPFGERNLEKQFNIKELERVINHSKDLKNNSLHSYQYRKQWMEAFLLVNQIGQSLPVYHNKPAKDLSNEEIKGLFQSIKGRTGRFKNMSTFQCQLYALGLMREAMYRSTGQFPYSTQILTLIDCMMHNGDMISGVDTGQGKSLIDSMKASLLWLTSDRVDLVTDSLENARRDMATYTPYLELLGIPYAKKPISPKLAQEDYCYNGINFSTGSQLQLFRAKLLSADQLKETDTVSMVSNETDFLVLDERTVYRFSSTSGSLIKAGDEWIYEEINAFVHTEAFKNKDNSESKDINLLKAHLKQQALKHQKNPATIDQFDNAQCLTWIKSAVTVNYILRENVDYVIPPHRISKSIHGKVRETRFIQILTKSDDGTGNPIIGRVNPDASYGDGVQQLLYAKLNKERDKNEFLIEPETKTLISSNNKNFIEYYRKRKGFIWGSTGTPGSAEEIAELYSKLGFDFSAIEPHQPRQLIVNDPVFFEDEKNQFESLLKKLQSEEMPSLVFFKDIDTAKKFADFIKNSSLKSQLFFGLGDEAALVKKAAEPKMITITTSAIGRNIDVLYDKEKGMAVYHTFLDSHRGEKQKSGRTGRQGSKGSVHYLYNKKDYHNKTENEIRLTAHEFAKSERMYHEDLFDLMNVLLDIVNNLKAEDFQATSKAQFIKDQWAAWSHNVEVTYRIQNANKNYRKESFNDTTINAFLRIFDGVLKPITKNADNISRLPSMEAIKARLPGLHGARDLYLVHQKEVTESQCIPPEVTAYGFLNTNTKSQPNIDLELVKKKLTALFTAAQTGQDVQKTHADYISYLNQNETNLAAIRGVHQLFLEDYIQKQIILTQKSAFSRWWNQLTGGLSQISDNRNFLLLFNGLTAVSADQPILKMDTLKLAITALLNEYLDESWFVNSARKAAVRQLKDKLLSVNTTIDLLDLLSTHRIEVIEADIKASATGFKELNLFGTSRYQNTLDKALSLTQALTGEFVKTDMISSLHNQLNKLTRTTVEQTPYEKHKTLDALQYEMQNSPVPKWATAAVLRKSLDKAVDIKMQQTEFKGMMNRFSLFAQNKPIDKENDNPSSEIRPVTT